MSIGSGIVFCIKSKMKDLIII